MSGPTGADAIVPAIEHLLRKGIAEATETVIAAAVRDFEVELRRKVAATALDISTFYDLHRDRENLVKMAAPRFTRWSRR